MPDFRSGEFQLATDSPAPVSAPRVYPEAMGWFKAKDLRERMNDSIRREFSNGLRFENWSG